MKRYEFIKGMAIGGSILITTPLLFKSCSKDEDTPGNGDLIIDLSDANYSALGTDGGFVYVGNIIVIRISSTSYFALSKICTHEGCEVFFNTSTGQLPCPCHGSVFDINGNVVKGPALTPIKKYSVSLSDNKLTIN